MRCTMSTPHFAVFDDFLKASELRELWRELRGEDYVFINKDVWERVYGLFDGRPLMGPGAIAGEGASDEQRYPTGRADPGWGGELLIGSDHTSRRRPRASSATVFNKRSAAIDSMSLGAFVVPLPNRMVIVKSGVPHRINTVDRSAGAHLRTSVAGFFVRG